MKALLYLVLVFSLTACAQPVYGKRPNPPIPMPMTNVATRGALQGKAVSPDKYLLKPESQALIILDPGHGGRDLGTHSKNTPKYQEKTLTLTTSRLVRGYLEKMGYTVAMTRNRDVFIPLEKRSEFANSRQPEVFVSIHFNSAPNKQAEGIEIFYYGTDDDKKRKNDSKSLAQNILKRIVKNTSAKSRGVKHGNLSVVRETTMPAVLVEGGFLTNEKEEQKIQDMDYLKKLAKGIAQGINDYVSR